LHLTHLKVDNDKDPMIMISLSCRNQFST